MKKRKKEDNYIPDVDDDDGWEDDFQAFGDEASVPLQYASQPPPSTHPVTHSIDSDSVAIQVDQLKGAFIVPKKQKPAPRRPASKPSFFNAPELSSPPPQPQTDFFSEIGMSVTKVDKAERKYIGGQQRRQAHRAAMAQARGPRDISNSSLLNMGGDDGDSGAGGGWGADDDDILANTTRKTKKKATLACDAGDDFDLDLA